MIRGIARRAFHEQLRLHPYMQHKSAAAVLIFVCKGFLHCIWYKSLQAQNELEQHNQGMRLHLEKADQIHRSL